ncbi:MAG TPA: MarR family transcriptional regulator, partial [Bacteroidaceae bacterium]|nr:MarR family transcriptional regulator [Bacteroidaceae bacterium]
LTPEGWTVMIFLWEKDGVSQQALCNATYRDKPGMTRLLDTLEKKHLVVRVTDRSDKRSKLIFLTNEGRQIESQARAATQRMLSNALKGLDSDELIISQEVLKQVFKNLSD